MKINCHNEWDKLREVIVGTVEGGPCMAYSTKQKVTPEQHKRVLELAALAYPKAMIEEANEDLEAMVKILKDHGVKVHRPASSGARKAFAGPDWSAGGEYLYNARDLHLVVGDTVIESPSQERYRYYEPHAFHGIWHSYFKEGFRWLAAPKPMLPDGTMITYEENGQRHQKLSEDEILFEAANVVRMGRDLLYLVSRSGNNLGAKWLQSALGSDYRVHPTSEVYRASHIDSTVLALSPGKVLLNGVRVNPKNCPSIFNKWDKIYFTEVVSTPSKTLDFHNTVRKKVAAELSAMGMETDLDHIASDWIGMNLLSLDPKTAIVDGSQVHLMKLLEKNGIKCIPVSFRHSHLLKGGIHCSTLDTVRDSKLESYFD